MREGLGFLGRRWFQLFVSWLVLLYLVERVLVETRNPNFVPSALLLGAFLVPVIRRICREFPIPATR
jgi:hypothetical protein